MNFCGPVKPREPRSTKDIVDRIVDEAGGPKQVSFFLGKHQSTVAGWTDPAVDSHMNFDHVRRLTARGCTVAAEDLASLAGGYFMPGHPDKGSLGDRFVAVARESGDLEVAIAMAHADGNISATDRKSIAKEAAEAIKALARLIHTIDQAEIQTPV